MSTNKVVAWAVSAAIASGLIVGAGYAQKVSIVSVQKQREIDAREMAEAAAESLQSEIAELEGDLADAEARADDAEQEIRAIKAGAGDLQTELDVAYFTISTLQSRLNRLMRAPRDFRVVCDDGISASELVDLEMDPCSAWRVDY